MVPRTLLLSVLVWSLIGCNTGSSAKPARDDAFVWLRSIDGFNAIDDEHIVLTSGRKYALVKTFGRCDGLRFAETIAVDAPLGFLDKSGLGHIIYERFPRQRGRCPIDKVITVESVQQAKDLVTKEKQSKQ